MLGARQMMAKVVAPFSFAATATATATRPRTATARRVLDAARGRRFWGRTLPLPLPLLLLGALLLASLLAIFLRTDQYGITIDEPLREDVGRALLRWYTTLGRDSSYFTKFSDGLHEPEHGGIFDAFITLVQFHVLPFLDHWLVRHLVTALVGWLGLGAIALCGYELGGGWVAFAAALGLWLYPRYEGAIYNNPKDVPATVTMLVLLWATLLLVKQWDSGKHVWRNGLLVGCSLGVAIAIRANAALWVAVLAALLGGWWLAHGRGVWQERRLRAEATRQGLSAAIIGVSSLLTTMALWPYVLINPLNLIRALQVLSHYPFEGSVLYDGSLYPATQLPRGYAPVWLVIGSPPILLLLALLGLGLFLAAAVRARRVDAPLAVVALAFAVPWSTILLLHAVLYDGLRHFLFLIPPLLLFAAWGLVRTVSLLTTLAQRGEAIFRARQQMAMRVVAASLLLVTLGSYALVARDMADLAPYEYAYFSPLVGGLPGASGRFDIDYWATCTRASAEWLAQHYREYTGKSAPSVMTPYPRQQITPFLPQTFQAQIYDSDLPQDLMQPDFYLSPTRVQYDQLFSGYTVIHVVAAQDVPLCVVKVNPQLAAT
jgi:hypothetical protein